MLSRHDLPDQSTVWFWLAVFVHHAASQNVSTTQNASSSTVMTDTSTAITTLLSTSSVQGGEQNDGDDSWSDLDIAKFVVSTFGVILTVIGLGAAFFYFRTPYKKNQRARNNENLLQYARDGLWDEMSAVIKKSEVSCGWIRCCAAKNQNIDWLVSDKNGSTVLHHSARLDQVMTFYKHKDVRVESDRWQSHQPGLVIFTGTTALSNASALK